MKTQTTDQITRLRALHASLPRKPAFFASKASSQRREYVRMVNQCHFAGFEQSAWTIGKAMGTLALSGHNKGGAP